MVVGREFLVGGEVSMKVPFKATIREAGDSFLITVPKAYVINDLLPVGIELDVEIENKPKKEV